MLVTHEARHAAWADRVVFLRDGVVVDETGSAPVEALLEPLLIGSLVVALPLLTAAAVGLTTRSGLPLVARID